MDTEADFVPGTQFGKSNGERLTIGRADDETTRLGYIAPSGTAGLFLNSVTPEGHFVPESPLERVVRGVATLLDAFPLANDDATAAQDYLETTYCRNCDVDSDDEFKRTPRLLGSTIGTVHIDVPSHRVRQAQCLDRITSQVR